MFESVFRFGGGNAGSFGFLSEFVPASVFDMTVSLDVECDFSVPVSSKFQLNSSISQTLSFSEKRGTLYVCQQPKRARMNIERPSVEAVPELIRRTPSPQVSPCKPVSASMPSRAPLQSDGGGRLYPSLGCTRKNGLRRNGEIP